MPENKRQSPKRKQKKAPWQRNDLAAVFLALAVCFVIVWLLIESGSSLFRDVNTDSAPFTGEITTPVRPIPVTDPPVTDPPVTDPPVTNPPETDPPVTNPPVTNPPVTNPPVTDPPVTDPPVTDPPVTDPPVTDPPVTNPPETDPPVTDPPVTNPPVFEPIVVVPESVRVDDSYFADALFIGDSRTVGLSLYSGLRSNYYSEVGLNLSTVFTKGYIGDAKLTLAQALTVNPSFTKVYLAFGINEISGWPSKQAFFDRYEELILLLREKLPHAQIAVQAIIPMSGAAASSDRYRDIGVNEKVAEYNRLLQAMCAEHGIYFIDVYEIFADENGHLYAADSTDGIHLGVASSRRWVDYLRTHPLP